ncbi:hypothetical protein [Flavobacterium chungnamense]|uniref:Uncharacterized protein n=1 Tax=Flavobacterium chungnamense TaxID=706182 RepID=A0ABP7V2K8_9FLAO
MSKPNTIPEFLGILVLTAVIFSVVGVFIGLVSEKIKSLINNNESTNLEDTISIKKNDLQISSEEKIEQTKFRISSMFYSFCFSSETAKDFLEESEFRLQISKGLMISLAEEKNVVEKIFKIFLEKKYNFILGESSYGTYRLNGYKFYIDKITCRLDEINTFFEILYNDFENVKDESGNNLAIAKEFILYVKSFKPMAIFVLVYDPIIEKYALRRVFENGTSINLIFLDDNEDSEAFDFLTNYVSKNVF